MNVKILLICNIARGNILILEVIPRPINISSENGWQLDDKNETPIIVDASFFWGLSILCLFTNYGVKDSILVSLIVWRVF